MRNEVERAGVNEKERIRTVYVCERVRRGKGCERRRRVGKGTLHPVQYDIRSTRLRFAVPRRAGGREFARVCAPGS